jgi:uncharacterized membrane protein
VKSVLLSKLARWCALFRDQSSRERAINLFSELRIWDTEHNNGVLIYLLLADKRVEIIADRGIHTKTGDAEWEKSAAIWKATFNAQNMRQVLSPEYRL